MISKALLEMIKGRWREFRREPSAMYFVVLMPVLWMLILGFAFSKPRPKVFSVGLVETSAVSPEGGTATQEGSLTAKATRELLADNTNFRFQLNSYDELSRGLRRGEQLLLVKFNGSKLSYEFDPTNPEAKEARLYFDDALERKLGRVDLIESSDLALTQKGMRYIDFLIPGLLALSMLTTSLYGTGMTLVAHRRENLLKRYRASPMKAHEYIISHIIGRFMILLVEFCVVILSGKLLFDFEIAGGFLSFVFMCFLSTACFASLALMCGSRLSNTATYNGLNNLITLPMMMVSGIWFSRASFPAWLSHISDALPLTASVDALRKLALEGAGLMDVQGEILLLSAYTFVAGLITLKSFKWY